MNLLSRSVTTPMPFTSAAAAAPIVFGVVAIVPFIPVQRTGDPRQAPRAAFGAVASQALVAAGELDAAEAVASGQVTLLVEDAVGGQVHLVVHVLQAAATEEQRSVVKAQVIGLQHAAGEDVDVQGSRRQRSQLGRVAAQRHL